MVEEPFITTFAYDDYHRTLLVGLIRGGLLRVVFVTPEVSIVLHGRQSVGSVLRESVVGEEFSKMLKISWCLELYAANQSAQWGTNALVDRIQQTPEMMGEFLARIESKVSKLAIHSIKYFVNTETSKPNLLISTNDGVVRIFDDAVAKIVSSPKIVLLERDKKDDAYHKGDDLLSLAPNAISAHVDILTNPTSKAKIDIGVGYTSQGKLILFNADDPEQTWSETQVLSKYCSFRGSTKEKAASMNIRISDEDEALGVISMGREWSIVDFNKTVTWACDSALQTI